VTVAKPRGTCGEAMEKTLDWATNALEGFARN
jgi:hypothetical protein